MFSSVEEVGLAKYVLCVAFVMDVYSLYFILFYINFYLILCNQCTL